MTSPALVPRPYQTQCIDAVDHHIATKTTNPCAVMDTGSGKSVVIAWLVIKWKGAYQALRVCILAHVKELVDQNSKEMLEVWPDADVGVYCAGLRRKEENHSITYASIDSVYKKGGHFIPFDVIIVDEAHRINPKAETKYQQFISMQKKMNQKLVVVGFTATDYRMSGALCHKDHVLQEVCYRTSMTELIKDGYLAPLWSKRSNIKPDVTDVKTSKDGEYILKQLSEVSSKDDVVQAAIKDAMYWIVKENRKSVMFFCVDIAHCEKVSVALRKYGIHAPYVHSKIKKRQRDKIAQDFKDGRLRYICNVDIYTTGFNAKQVDCIVLLRMSKSRGLYKQIVGRGSRVNPRKENCLILDYAGLIDEHGPVDTLESGDVIVCDCGECGNAFSKQVRICPICGWQIPKQEIERLESEDKERKMHERQASNKNILSGEPEEFKVDAVTVHRHRKNGKPDSIRVQYRCGMNTFREWVCLDHEGYSGENARKWWSKRFGEEEAKTITVDEAMGNMYLLDGIKAVTETITVVQRGKFTEITDYQITHDKILADEE